MKLAVSDWSGDVFVIDLNLVPETLDWCRRHYTPPVKEFILCKDFGCCDGMDGTCIWCREMMPYQFAMCYDESWISGLLSPVACIPARSREEAAEFIERYKQEFHSTFD